MNWNTIIVALISLVGTLVGTYAGIYKSTQIATYRLDKLEEKVDKHNSVVERTYVLEEKVKANEHSIDEVKDIVRSMARNVKI